MQPVRDTLFLCESQQVFVFWPRPGDRQTRAACRTPSTLGPRVHRMLRDERAFVVDPCR
jgi:hypothetical protein